MDAVIVTVAVADPPEESVILAGEIETITFGFEEVAERLTIPPKPLRPVMVIVEETVRPLPIANALGLAVREKSGGGPTTFTIVDTE